MNQIREKIISINKWDTRFGFKVKGIVLHSMAGTYIGTLTWFGNPIARVSAHYCISKEGEVSLCVEEDDTAWHAGNVTVDKEMAPGFIKDNWGVNPNLISIGIEMEDERNFEHKYTKEQYLSALELVADICNRYDLDPTRGNIVMHKEIDPINKSDPIGYWDHDKFVDDVKFLIEKGGVKTKEFYPFSTTVTVRSEIDTLYVRSGPSTVFDLSGSQKLKGGESFGVTGFVKGERISYGSISTQFWWESTKGNYIWSGGTDLIPTLDNFPVKMQETLDKSHKPIMNELEQTISDLEVRVSEIEVLLARKAEEKDAILVEIENLKATVEESAEEVEEVIEEAVEAPVEEVVEIVEESVVEETPVIEDAESEAVSRKSILEAVESLLSKHGVK